MAVATVIIVSARKLLRDSVRLSLDGVPRHIDYDAIDRAIRHNDRVKDYHYTCVCVEHYAYGFYGVCGGYRYVVHAGGEGGY